MHGKKKIRKMFLVEKLHRNVLEEKRVFVLVEIYFRFLLLCVRCFVNVRFGFRSEEK